MTKYIYIHGLNSSKKSSKFKILQDKFNDISILEWNLNSNIDIEINSIASKLEKTDSILIIGDSTGGNFACQLRDKLNSLNIYSKLVLINPLLKIESLINNNIMPNSIIKYIKPIDEIKDALILISNNDKIVDNKNLEKFTKTTKIIKVDDVHKLITFEQYIETIDNYSKNITL